MPKNPDGSGSNPRPPRGKTLEAINALLAGQAKTQADACRAVGIAPQVLCRALQKPHVQEFIRQQIDQRFRTVGVINAANALEHLVAHAESEYVRADVSKHLLAINGVKPKAERSSGGSGGVVIQINLPAGIGASGVHGQTIEAQRIDMPALSEGGHCLDKGEADE